MRSNKPGVDLTQPPSGGFLLSWENRVTKEALRGKYCGRMEVPPLPLVIMKKLFSTVRIFLHDLIFPNNVVKIRALPRSWCDRDEVMYHAIFQILVDFVELEKPFLSWDDPEKFKYGRFTDRVKMRERIEKHSVPHLEDDMPPDVVVDFTKSAAIAKANDLEVLELYEWYKDKGYEFDRFKYREMIGEKITVDDNNQIQYVDTGTPKTLSWHEYHEMERAHRELCEANLQRVIKIRGYLWT